MENKISELIEQFERDIRAGCHSTFIEASRSKSGKQLLDYVEKKQVHKALYARWKQLGDQRLNAVENSVRNAIGMLIQWMDQDAAQ